MGRPEGLRYERPHGFRNLRGGGLYALSDRKKRGALPDGDRAGDGLPGRRIARRTAASPAGSPAASRVRSGRGRTWTGRLRREVRRVSSSERQGRTGICRPGSDSIRARAAGRERPADRRPPASRPPHKPPIPLAPADISDIATFLHREITYAAERSNYQLQYVMTGNAKAGEAYFNGAGGCSRCHSPTGDLKGIGSRHDGPTLQALIAFGTISGGGRGRGRRGRSASRTARRATVTLPSGETFSGVLVRLTDFDVTIRDDAGRPRVVAAQRQHAQGAGHRSAAGTHRPAAEIQGRRHSRSGRVPGDVEVDDRAS